MKPNFNGLTGRGLAYSGKRFIAAIFVWFFVWSLSGCSVESGPKTVPDVETGEITGISPDGAIANGEVISDGNLPVQERGVAVGQNANPTISDIRITSGSGLGDFSAEISGLSPAQTYHVRAYATNAKGISYGSDRAFQTGTDLPVLTTAPGSSITLVSAVTGGSVVSDGGATVSVRGVCWGTSQNPTIQGNKTTDGSGTGAFVSVLQGLTPSTVYYIRAYATNLTGTAYGPQEVIQTLPGAKDIDGNVYPAVVIGTQIWMKENLKVSQYRNGDPIPNVTEDIAWSGLTQGAFASYDNNIMNEVVYGKLYNWYAAVDPRGICPAGWHTPTDAEWTALGEYLGGNTVAGGKLKVVGTEYWRSPNGAATNESQFSALPGGFRNGGGIFSRITYDGYWWSSTAFSATDAWDRALGFDTDGANLFRYGNPKQSGFSVRCIKD